MNNIQPNQIDLNELQSNIYGPKAVGMLGGSILETFENNAKRKKHKGGANNYETVAYAEYIKNQDFLTFMNAFYLIRKITHTPSAGVYIIPNKKELNEMIKKFHDELNEKNIEIGSDEAVKYAAIKELPYKRCIFTVFGGDNAHYKLDKEAPYKNFGVVKRVNLYSEIMYFKYVSDDEIMICNSEECKKGTTVKLIAKCNNGIYVFQGSIPEAKETKSRNSVTLVNKKNTNKKKTKKTKKSMKGGNLENEEEMDEELELDSMLGGKKRKVSNKNKIKSKKLKYMLNNVTDENSACNFIATMALAEYQKNGDEAFEKYSKMLSGDLLHSAFRIVFNDEIETIPEVEYSNEDKNIIMSELVQRYNITNKVFDQQKYSSMFKNIYKKIAQLNLSPKQSTIEYKKVIRNKFNKVGMNILKADIATSMYRNGQPLQLAIKYADAIDDLESNAIIENDLSKLEYNSNSDQTYQTSRYNYIINKAITSIPLIGLNAQTYSPVIANLPITKSVFSFKRNMKGGATDASEENHDNDDFDEVDANEVKTEFNEDDENEFDFLNDFI